MNHLNLLLVSTVLLLVMPACSRTDTPTEGLDADAAARLQPQAPFLAQGEVPKANAFKLGVVEAHLTEAARQRAEAFGGGEEVDIYVRLTNNMGISVDNWISDDPAHVYEYDGAQIAYSTACGKEVLMVVVRTDVNTGVSVGTGYHNALFDPATGEWITTFRGGEIKDRETGEIISDDQKVILSRLKAGIRQNCPQILDPNNRKASEQLLQ